MKNRINQTLLIIILCLSLQGICLADKLVIVGTGSSASILKAVGKAFSKRNPDVAVVVPKSIGSGGGIRAVGNDEYTLGRVARKLTGNDSGFDLQYLPYAQIPIVFFVNNSVLVKDITTAQACKIFNGTIRKWEKIDSSEQGIIRVIRREDGDSSLRVLLESLPGFKDITLTKRSKTTFSDPKTIAECKKQKNSIAFGTWPNIKNENAVSALKINHIHPVNPAYSYTGELALIYKEKNFHGNVQRFIEFFATPAARKAIIDAGGQPVK